MKKQQWRPEEPAELIEEERVEGKMVSQGPREGRLGGVLKKQYAQSIRKSRRRGTKQESSAGRRHLELPRGLGFVPNNISDAKERVL